MARRRSRLRTGSGGKLRGIRAEVLGLDEVKDVFNALPAKVQKTVVKDALLASAEHVHAEQLRHVPVASGQLFRSLQIFPVRYGKTRARIEVGAGPEGFYGQFIEYGFTDRGGGQVPARPWLRPALDASFRPTINTFREEFRDGLDPIVDQLRRRAGA